MHNTTYTTPSKILHSVPSDRISTFSCGHIVPKSSICTFILSKGPTNTAFRFDYNSQTKIDLIDELGRVVLNYSMITPGGIVVFFPSYRYLSSAYSRWTSTGVIVSVQETKKVFCESRTSKNLLCEYNAHIKSSIEQGVRAWKTY